MVMENLGAVLSDSSRLLRRAFDARARGAGMTRPQWQVLTTLRRSQGLNQAGLADQLEVEPITVCRMVDRLQEAGYVERRADPSDRRSWRLYLTPRAEGLLAQLRPLADALVEEALEGVTAEERETLRTALEKIRENLSRRPAETASAANG